MITWILWRFRNVRAGIAAFLYLIGGDIYRNACSENMIKWSDFNL